MPASPPCSVHRLPCFLTALASAKGALVVGPAETSLHATAAQKRYVYEGVEERERERVGRQAVRRRREKETRRVSLMQKQENPTRCSSVASSR